MRIKTLILSLFLLLIFLNGTYAQESEKIFTIYLVRHAEKELSAENPKDPPLTPCGEKRAESLANLLKNVQLDVIYSTEYLRTKETAQPVANEKEKELTYYDPVKLADFAKLLLKNKEDVLVVGHSNTTPVLAGLLIGEDLEPFDESIYNLVYQVVVSKDKGRLHVFHTAVVCNK